jgi:hypothetical protein
MTLSMRERIALLIGCPYCEQDTQKPIAWLIKCAEIPCDYCGRLINIQDRDNSFRIAEIAAVADRLDKRCWRPPSQRR